MTQAIAAVDSRERENGRNAREPSHVVIRQSTAMMRHRERERETSWLTHRIQSKGKMQVRKCERERDMVAASR